MKGLNSTNAAGEMAHVHVHFLRTSCRSKLHCIVLMMESKDGRLLGSGKAFPTGNEEETRTDIAIYLPGVVNIFTTTC